MFTVMCILALLALIGAVAVMMGKLQVGPVLLLLAIVEALHCIPLK